MTHTPNESEVDRFIFIAAAAYNIILSLIALLATDFYFRVFFATPVSNGPILYMNTQTFWVAMLLFGFGYLSAARDWAPNRGVLWIGAIGKIYLFIVWTTGFFYGITTIAAVLGGTGDLIFAALFIRFLLSDREFVPLLRTPEDEFRNLPDFPFRPNYIDVFGTRVHYLDEGQGSIILCLHGEPSWCYLYRKMIPILSRNYRVIAPDFIGSGRSDKYSRRTDYSFAMHRDMLQEFIRKLNISQAILVVQDWGGPVGLRVLSMQPDLFTHLVVLNTDVPIAEEQASFAARCWVLFVKLDLMLPIGMIMWMGTVNRLAAEVIRAYRAPFKTESYKSGVWAWPLFFPDKSSSPVSEEMHKTRLALKQWKKPAAVMFSDGDPINSGRYQFFRDLIPTGNGPHSARIEGAGHFLQEDKGEEIADRILKFLREPAV